MCPVNSNSLYKERMQDIDQKMDLLTEGNSHFKWHNLIAIVIITVTDSAPEYTNPVKELKDSIDHRLQAAGGCL